MAGVDGSETVAMRAIPKPTVNCPARPGKRPHVMERTSEAGVPSRPDLVTPHVWKCSLCGAEDWWW